MVTFIDGLPPWCRNCNHAVTDCRCERSCCLPECAGCSRHVPTLFFTCWTARRWREPVKYAPMGPLARKMIEDYLKEWRAGE